MIIDEMIEINRDALAQFVLFNAKEIDNWETYIPENVDQEEVWDGITRKNVTEVDSYGDTVEVHGEFTVRAVVDRIPASGGAKGEPPINPPEVITEKREVQFVVRFLFEDLGDASGTIEVL